jgi:amino acid adenylation domain-containing protein
MRYLVHHLLRDAAQEHPERVAVVDGDRELTYRELDERTDQLAGALRAASVAPGDRVGLHLEKSAEAVVGIYGILKAGAAYVPLDPDAPTTRVAFITRNCEIRHLITATTKQAAWEELCQQAPQIGHLFVTDQEPPDDAAVSASVVGPGEVGSADPARISAPTVDADVAYILYTSGSTGTPKGVTLTHRNAMSFVEWAAEEFQVRPEDRLSSHAPFHFDLSIFDLFAAARAAATLVLVPKRTSVFPSSVARFIRDQRISIWYSVPSVLTMLTLRGGVDQGDFPALRTVLFAGEVFPTKYLCELTRRLPHVRFANLYGPTETNVCTWYEVPPLPDDLDDTIPIGKAITNDVVYVVTEDDRLALPGEIGELFVRGATVMRGYWGDRERTDAALVPNPFGTSPHDLVYKTGDLVELDADGNHRYRGRRDAQIKSRGYRIELGEIETALDALPGVAECATVPVPDELVTNRIVAFVSLAEAATTDDLLRACRERLPTYMVPDRIEILTDLPKTSTGKVDRQQLRHAAEELPKA